MFKNHQRIALKITQKAKVNPFECDLIIKEDSIKLKEKKNETKDKEGIKWISFLCSY